MWETKNHYVFFSCNLSIAKNQHGRTIYLFAIFLSVCFSSVYMLECLLFDSKCSLENVNEVLQKLLLLQV